MTTEQVFHAIGGLSDDLLMEVEAIAFGASRRTRAVTAGAVAAAAGMAIAGTLWYLRARRARATA